MCYNKRIECNLNLKGMQFKFLKIKLKYNM